MIKGLYLHHINQLLWGVDLKVGGFFMLHLLTSCLEFEPGEGVNGLGPVALSGQSS